MIVATGNQALGDQNSNNKQKFLLFNFEELELFSEINKWYVDQEKTASRKLRKVATKLQERKDTKGEEFKYKVT